jgi:hypothetical protein
VIKINQDKKPHCFKESVGRAGMRRGLIWTLLVVLSIIVLIFLKKKKGV